MKFSASIILCSFVIYATISSVNVAAEETTIPDTSTSKTTTTTTHDTNTSERTIPDTSTSTITSDVVSSNDTVEIANEKPCISQYLKNIGKLDDTFPYETPTAPCNDTMIEVFRVVREMINDTITSVLPSETDCLMTEYDKSTTRDTVLTILQIKMSDLLVDTRKDTLLVRPVNDLEQQLKAMTNQCGLNDETFRTMFGKLFETTTTVSKIL